MAQNTQETLKPAQTGNQKKADKRLNEVTAEPMFAQLTRKAEKSVDRK